MKLRNGPVILLVLAVFAVIGVVCNTTGKVVEIPDELAGAAATRTAIAPAIVPTMRYNEYVLPTQQAEEANQISATVQRQYENARSWSDFMTKCKRVALGALTIFSAIATASGAGTLIGAVVCYIVERAKKAKAYEPVQELNPYGAYLFPRQKTATQMLTSGTWSITTERPADVQGGALLVEAKIGDKMARYKFTPRNERHPVTIDAWGRQS